MSKQEDDLMIECVPLPNAPKKKKKRNFIKIIR